MSEIYQRLAHSSWDGKYHVVLCRSGDARCCLASRQLGEIFHALARQKECQIIEGHLLPDHVHMCIAIPPKYPVASVIGFLKGKSAIAMARLCGKERNFTGSTSGPADTRCPRWASSWNKSANTSASNNPPDGNSGGF